MFKVGYRARDTQNTGKPSARKADSVKCLQYKTFYIRLNLYVAAQYSFGNFRVALETKTALPLDLNGSGTLYPLSDNGACLSAIAFHRDKLFGHKPRDRYV